jgi:hypothetical protein
MPNPSLRPWTEEDKANLKSLAGKLSQEIAARLGRSPNRPPSDASLLDLASAPTCVRSSGSKP